MATSKSPGADELENWHRWFLVKDQDWAPPAALTPDALDKFTDHRIIWLKDAVDLMAFGSEAPASNSDERAVRRQQACRTICMGAGTDKFDVTGCEGLSVGGAGQKIPISYFDLDRRLADQDNRLEVDRERLSDTDFNINFNAQTEQHWGLWCEVRVEAPRFLTWLRSLLAPKEAGQSNSSTTVGILKSDDVIYREWVARHEGQTPPSRDADRDHLRAHFPNITQDRIRTLRRELAPPSWKSHGRRPGTAAKK
jgi:hypothetical protein